jgi:hypothetical protein
MIAAVLSPVEIAQARADRIRTGLMAVHAELIEAWTAGDHERLGYGAGVTGWAAYCAAEFGQLLNVLPTDEQLGVMADAGMTQRAIAAPFGVSLGKVNDRLRRRRGLAPAAGATEPVAGGCNVARVLAVLAAAPAPLTVFQVMKKARLRQAQVSPLLSRLAAAGRVTYTAPAKRGGIGTWH